MKWNVIMNNVIYHCLIICTLGRSNSNYAETSWSSYLCVNIKLTNIYTPTPISMLLCFSPKSIVNINTFICTQNNSHKIDISWNDSKVNIRTAVLSTKVQQALQRPIDIHFNIDVWHGISLSTQFLPWTILIQDLTNTKGAWQIHSIESIKSKLNKEIKLCYVI